MGKRTIDLLFTLYGDYIRHRGGEARIGSLVRLLSCLGVSAQAVRSTVARLAQQGWLARRREGRHSLYAVAPQMAALLAEGAQRIYYPPPTQWDGGWYVVDYALGESQRQQRNRLRSKLLWLGFGQLSSGTWISAHDLRPELTRVFEALGLARQVTYFRAEYLGFADEIALVAHCWDLPGLNAGYRRFLSRHQAQFESARRAEQAGDGLSPRECFVRRFWLVHEFRRFPYRDPRLPAHLLPAGWLGEKVTELFREYQALLTDKANAFVDNVLAGWWPEGETLAAR